MDRILRIAGPHFEQLRAHLFPGDGKEAVALLLCGRFQGRTAVLASQAVFPIPHSACALRAPDLINWPTSAALPAIERARAEELSVIKVHCHPTGWGRFSEQDDRSDSELLTSLSGWTLGTIEHGSAVLLPNGRLFGRMMTIDGRLVPLDRIAIAGADLVFWDNRVSETIRAADQRNAQAFGPGTVKLLKTLSVGIAGCSGTGSWVVEMLARLGVGRLVLVDPDRVEDRNLNRIVGSTKADADAARLKVDVMKRSVEAMGFGTVVEPFATDLAAPETIKALAECDVLFGCLDSADGREILNRISSCFCIPFFDVGVRLDADGQGGVNYVGGAVHYIEPGGSSLLSRRVITSEGMAADELRRTNPDEFERRRKEGYIRGAAVDSPAVSSVNGFHAAMAVNDFLARIHPFRLTPNHEIDAVCSNITGGYLHHESVEDACPVYSRLVGRSGQAPLLDRVGL